ncbi:hypothetical protein EVAR_67742_1 [Eumeta japonica]|uniref:Uncharacterized protein n=1 Tax=Eumeta variegata TaxID=151549 RepID=A0A4C1ZG95_EUMVA|nr:hypothetical protein EVAR_67742_1 [Eumeta japonica]
MEMDDKEHVDYDGPDDPEPAGRGAVAGAGYAFLVPFYSFVKGCGAALRRPAALYGRVTSAAARLSHGARR